MDIQKIIREKWFYLVILAIALALPFIIPSKYMFQVVIMCTIYAIATLSLNLILGYTGQAALSHAGFFGIGAYGVGIMTKAGLSFWLALPLSALLAAAVGLLIALPTLRTRGSYFAITTLCFGVIVSIVAGNWVSLTGGFTGVNGIPRPTPISVPFIGEISFASQTGQYYLVLGFLLLTLFVMHRLVFSLNGLSYMAVRNNEALADAVGINTFTTKVVSFVTANFFAAIAGGLYAVVLGSVSPTTASYHLTFFWLIYLMLGGVATLAGPIIGAFAIPLLMEYMQFLAEYRLIIFGALLIVVIIYFPRGLMGALDNLWNRIKEYNRSRKAGADGAVESPKSDQAI